MGRIRTNRPVGSFFLRKDIKPNKEGKSEIYVRYYFKRMPAKSPKTVWIYEKDCMLIKLLRQPLLSVDNEDF